MKNTAPKIVILSAVRTPIGKYGGGFKDTSAVALGTAASVEAMKRAGVPPGQVDEVIFGMARQAGNRPNPARQVLYRSGIPVEKTAFIPDAQALFTVKAVFSTGIPER